MEQNMRNILISGTSEEEQLMKDSSAALSLKPLAAESSGITRDQQAEAVVKNVGNPKSADVEEDVPMTFPQRVSQWQPCVDNVNDNKQHDNVNVNVNGGVAFSSMKKRHVVDLS